MLNRKNHIIRSSPGVFAYRNIPVKNKEKPPENNYVPITPSLGKIKDELFLITFFIICSGLVYTDSYYQQFGIKYQFLNLSLVDIIYRGLTLILHYPSILLPYFLAIGAMVIEIVLTRMGIKRFMDFKIPFAYLFLFINLLIIYPIADSAGTKQALRDMNAQSTGLPKIMYMEAFNGELTLQSKDNFALFSNNSDLIYYFQLVNNTSTKPIIKCIKKSDIKSLDISR
jgi:hypothetical protein